MNEPLHQFSNVVFKGVDPSEAEKAVIFVHGRGDASDGMQQLAAEVVQEPNVAFAFPRATHHTWYPTSFFTALAVKSTLAGLGPGESA